MVYLIYRVKKTEAEPPATLAPSELAQLDGEHEQPKRTLAGSR